MQKVVLFALFGLILSLALTAVPSNLYAADKAAVTYASDVKGDTGDDADYKTNMHYNNTEIVADPLEPFNRAVFSFNNFVIDYLISPIIDVYRFIVPEFLRQGVHNFVWNLKAPVIIVSELLQGDVENADIVFRRFFVNSTAGLGGLIDVASFHGLDAPLPEDMGQTFAKWGAGEGFYLVLPLLGPSTIRDVSGEVLDCCVLDPFSAWARNTDEEHLIYYRTGLRGLDWADENIDSYQDMVNSSVDPYVTMRSAYIQFRRRLVNDGAVDTSGYDAYADFEE